MVVECKCSRRSYRNSKLQVEKRLQATSVGDESIL
jgi:hypothetical protein